MSGVTLAIDASGFAKLSERLAHIERRIPLAIAMGLNEGGDKVRTQVQRQLKKQTNVKAYKSITSRIRTVRAFGGGGAPLSGIGPAGLGGTLRYMIVATGKGIPIAEFPVRATKGGIDAQTWGVDHLFKRSFGIDGRGVDGFRARLSSKRFPIRKLYGPALPKELGKGATPSVFFLATAAFVPPAIVKHLGKAL